MKILCQKYETNMIPGRRRDRGNSFAKSQEAWLLGVPKGEVLGWFSGYGDALPVITYACPSCGYLEFYVPSNKLQSMSDNDKGTDSNP